MIKEISAEELEAACRKCIRIKVSDTGILTRVLDQMQLDYRVLSESEADIYAKITVTELVLALAGKTARFFPCGSRMRHWKAILSV